MRGAETRKQQFPEDRVRIFRVLNMFSQTEGELDTQ